MDLQLCEPKNELWRETEALRRSKKQKIGFEVQYRTLEGACKDMNDFKHILEYS